MEDLIFDRTEQDIEEIAELKAIGFRNMTQGQKDKWMAGMKGALNARDLNRVDGYINYLYARIEFEAADLKEDWEMTDLPTKPYFERLLVLVAQLRKDYVKHKTTPPVPKGPLTHFEKWNDIEHILYDLYEIYQKNQEWKEYCGEVNSLGGII